MFNKMEDIGNVIVTWDPFTHWSEGKVTVVSD